MNRVPPAPNAVMAVNASRQVGQNCIWQTLNSSPRPKHNEIDQSGDDRWREECNPRRDWLPSNRVVAITSVICDGASNEHA